MSKHDNDESRELSDIERKLREQIYSSDSPFKKKECDGCIGISDSHTCDGWKEFQEMKARKNDCGKCAAEIRKLTDQLEQRDFEIRMLRDHLDEITEAMDRFPVIECTKPVIKEGELKGYCVLYSGHAGDCQFCMVMQSAGGRGQIRDASCLDSGCPEGGHNPQCDHAESNEEKADEWCNCAKGYCVGKQRGCRSLAKPISTGSDYDLAE